MPNQTFTHVGATAAGTAEVWSALQRPETWEGVPGVDRVISPRFGDDGSLQGFSFESAAGGRKYLGQALPGKTIEGRSMVWEITTPEIKGILAVELAAVDKGTSVRVTLEVQSVGMLSTAFFPLIAGSIGSGFPKAVDQFTAGLE